MGTPNNEMNEFIKLMNEVDPNSFSLEEQMYCGLAMVEFMNKVKPIYMKHAAKDPEATTFLFKM